MLDPAENLFYLLALLLARLKPRIVPLGRTQPVGPLLRLHRVFGHMRHHLPLPQSRDEVLFLITFVCSQGDDLSPHRQFVHHRQRCFPLCPRTRLRHTRRHYQPVAVFREHVSQVTRSRFRRLAASEQPRLTIRLRLVRVAQQLAPPRSRAPLRRVRFLLETPPTRPRLDQGPVHREVSIARQLPQRYFRQRPNPPQGMLRRDPLFRIHIAEHCTLLLIISAHASSYQLCLWMVIAKFDSTSTFSAACKAGSE